MAAPRTSPARQWHRCAPRRLGSGSAAHLAGSVHRDLCRAVAAAPRRAQPCGGRGRRCSLCSPLVLLAARLPRRWPAAWFGGQRRGEAPGTRAEADGSAPAWAQAPRPLPAGGGTPFPSGLRTAAAGPGRWRRPCRPWLLRAACCGLRRGEPPACCRRCREVSTAAPTAARPPCPALPRSQLRGHRVGTRQRSGRGCLCAPLRRGSPRRAGGAEPRAGSSAVPAGRGRRRDALRALPVPSLAAQAGAAGPLTRAALGHGRGLPPRACRGSPGAAEGLRAGPQDSPS